MQKCIHQNNTNNVFAYDERRFNLNYLLFEGIYPLFYIICVFVL